MEKEQLLDDLQTSYAFLQRLEKAHLDAQAAQEEVMKAQSEQRKNIAIAQRCSGCENLECIVDLDNLILGAKVAGGASIAAIVVWIYCISYQIEYPFWVSFLIGIAIGIAWAIGKGIRDAADNRAVVELAKMRIPQYSKKIEECRLHYQEMANHIPELLNSSEGVLATQTVPPDYFYSAAVEKFIYYLRNGHADTMKEALREYDTKMHQQKLEMQAELTRQEAERAAAAAEYNAAVNEEYAKQMKKAADEANFLNMYNAYQLAEIRKDLNQ